MLVYDIEIIRAIKPADGVLEPGVEYANGWDDFQRLGISTLCCYDLREQRYRVFLKDNLAEFAELLAKRGQAAGYNNHIFDDRMLKAHGLWPEGVESYDLLREIWRAAGADPDAPFVRATHGGLGLDAVARANAMSGKTETGNTIPILWQQGMHGRVIDHCLNDVRLTLLLLAAVQRRGYLYNPRQAGDRLWIRRPLSEAEGKALASLAI